MNRLLEMFDAPRLAAELKENFRLRLGVWMILVILLTWVSLVWSDANRAMYDTTRVLEREWLSLSEMESAGVWQSRLQEMEQAAASESAKIWSADSAGLAQAKVQATLGSLLLRDEFVNQSIKAGIPQPLPDLDGVYRLRVRVGTSFTPQQLRDSLLRLSRQVPHLEVDQLELRRNGVRWNAELVLSAYFRLEDSQ